MNKRTVMDLTDHASNQIMDVIHRTGDLLDDPGERNLYYVTLFGRFLARIAKELDEDEDDEPTPDKLMIATLLMIQVLGDRDSIQGMTSRDLNRRAEAVWKRLVVSWA